MAALTYPGILHTVAPHEGSNFVALFCSLLLHAGIGAWACWPARDAVTLPQQQVIEVAILMESALQEEKEITQKSDNKELIVKETILHDAVKYHAAKTEDTKRQTKSVSMPITGLQMENATSTSAATMPPVFNAAYLENTPPSYPITARRRNIEGKVLLHVEVSQDGLAESVTVLQTSGSELLDEAARVAVTAWKFVPAHRGNENVSAGVAVPIVFSLR